MATYGTRNLQYSASLFSSARRTCGPAAGLGCGARAVRRAGPRWACANDTTNKPSVVSIGTFLKLFLLCVASPG